MKKFGKIAKYFILTVLFLSFGFLDANNSKAATDSGTVNKFFAADQAPQYVSMVYTWGSMIVGGLSLIVIAYAGITYMRSMGSPEVISQSKNLISGALVGLFLVLGGYMLLRIMDPRLVDLKLSVKDLGSLGTDSGKTCQSLVGNSCSKNGEVVSCIDNKSWICIPVGTSGNLSGTDAKYDKDMSKIQCVNGKYLFTHEKLLSRYYNSKTSCGCDSDTPAQNTLFAKANCASGESKAIETVGGNTFIADCVRIDRVCVPYTGSTGN